MRLYVKMIISESASGSSQLQVKGFTHVMICPIFLPAKNVKTDFTCHRVATSLSPEPRNRTLNDAMQLRDGQLRGHFLCLFGWRFGHRHGKGSYARLQFFQVRLPVQYVGGFLNTKVSHTNWSLGERHLKQTYVADGAFPEAPKCSKPGYPVDTAM